MTVYDTRQDREKTLFRKLYEGLVGCVAKLLKNTPRDEVATRTDLSGPGGTSLQQHLAARGQFGKKRLHQGGASRL